MSKSYVPVWLRERVAAQARHRCGYCLTAEAVTGAPLVIEHLIPEALGGPTEEANLWLACSQYNLHKGDRIIARDPLTESGWRCSIGGTRCGPSTFAGRQQAMRSSD